MRLTAHLPRHRSLHSCAPCAAPCGQQMLAVLASASLVVPVTLSRKQPRPLRAEEEKERVARVRATSAPSLPPFHSGRSVTEASPFFQIFFFLALTRLLSRTPRGLLSLGENPLGVLFKKAGFNSREKKLRGSGRIKGDGESLGCQVKGIVNNCGGFR